MRTSIPFATLLGFLACAATAHARDPVEISTPYYTVVSVLSEKETRRLLEEMRTFQAVLTTFTSVKDLRPQVPLRIHLVESSTWMQYLRPTSNVAGYMSPRPLGFDAVMDAYSWSNASTILFHEYTHFVLRNAHTGRYPIWFDEGFATLLSTVKTIGKEVRVGEPPAETLISLRAFPRARWTPLGELLRAQKNPANDQEQGSHQVNGFYAQCWALVHYMVFVYPNGSKSLFNYLLARQRGTDVDVAFKNAFGTSIEDIDEKLQRYVQQKSFPIIMIDPKKLSLPDIGAYEAHKLDEFSEALDFGRLLVRLGARQDRALEYFGKLLKAQPSNAQALAGKANVLEQMQRHAEADVAIGQALAAAPNDQMVLIFAGNIHYLRATPRTPTVMDAASARSEDALKTYDYYDRAMAQAGDVTSQPEIVTRYANFALRVRADLTRALERLAETRKRYPTSPDLAFVHARVLTEMGRTAEAREAWRAVAEYGSGAARAAAERIIESSQ